MWKNIVEPGRLQMTIWHMLIAGCIPKGYTHTRAHARTHARRQNM